MLRESIRQADYETIEDTVLKIQPAKRETVIALLAYLKNLSTDSHDSSVHVGTDSKTVIISEEG